MAVIRLQLYLETKEKVERLRILKDMKATSQWISIATSEDLLCLDIGIDEKMLILDNTRHSDSLKLELFLLSHIPQWSQELAALAVRIWSQRTEHRLWFHLVDIITIPGLAQRVFYTIIDQAFEAGGYYLIKEALNTESLFEMSHALHALVLLRATQWEIKDDRIRKLAHRSIGLGNTSFTMEHRATTPALAYLARFYPEDIFSFRTRNDIYEPWSNLLSILSRSLKNPVVPNLGSDTGSLSQLLAEWPTLWERNQLTSEQVSRALTICVNAAFADKGKNYALESQNIFWEIFGGVEADVLIEALNTLDDDFAFIGAVRIVHGLISRESLQKIADRVKKIDDHHPDYLTLKALEHRGLNLPWPGTSVEAQKNIILADIYEDENAWIKQNSQNSSIPAQKRTTNVGEKLARLGHYSALLPEEHDEHTADFVDRKAFFDLAYRAKSVSPGAVSGLAQTSKTAFWSILLQAWMNPTEDKIASLAVISRQQKGIYRLCYLNTLARFKGLDLAALKILDFVRSDQEDDIKAVIFALDGIDTPRATQELISALTRPNITQALQLEALTLLKRHDLSLVQPQLRSSISDIGSPTNVGSWEVRDLLSSLIQPNTAQFSHSMIGHSEALIDARDSSFDQSLSGRIQGYKDLSSEVKRALRTSLFFHQQVLLAKTGANFDLSPVIDMQYKALELLFRESFEDPCSRVINRGILQRKLDIIGYARPIPHQMDDFENYIESLPIVQSIPFFSKFKLRKMLRAICQFRPGKRFTLDGLKAFALFFLCFGRKECRFGLGEMMKLGFEQDADLFEFCRNLHMFQDRRNRAAHEGLHPEASDDLDKIWILTAEIVQLQNRMSAFLSKQAGNYGNFSRDSGQEHPVIVTKRVS